MRNLILVLCSILYLVHGKEQKHSPIKCSVNETYSSCSFACPSDDCRAEGEGAQPVCDAPNPCPPGCNCKPNYKRNTRGQCILATDCPFIECSGQNERYDSCPSPCVAVNCKDMNNQTSTCDTLIYICEPSCICETGYCRNSERLCVPASQCSA